MSKVYDSGKTLNEKILKGVNILADNVSATLGPKGRNVILKGKKGNPVITKDGVTVAKFIDLEDPFENLGAQVIKQASAVTNTVAGDGTTTATVLARSILENSQKHLAAGVSPVEMKRGMDKAVIAVVESLESQSRMISSEDDISHIIVNIIKANKTLQEKIIQNANLFVNQFKNQTTITDACQNASCRVTSPPGSILSPCPTRPTNHMPPSFSARCARRGATWH